jgi:hypothetical protein
MSNAVTGVTGNPSLAIAPISPKGHRGGNANMALTYTYQGVYYSAMVRCTKLAISYSLNSEESHSRQTKAFYPHRRAQGQFAITLALVGWNEYSQAMGWFTRFARQALAMSSNDPALWVEVSMPSRKFTRWGIPTTGMNFGDHTASMVFSPTITFISVRDPNDPSTAILSGRANQISRQSNAGIDPLAVSFFYPSSAVNTPGKLDESLYGPTGALPALPTDQAQQQVSPSSPSQGIGRGVYEE